MSKIRVTIWNEFVHEQSPGPVQDLYPEGLHKAIGKGISADDLEIRYATLDEPENGLPQEVVDNTDVMIWWGHCAHHKVDDEVVKRVHKRVQEGMGMIILHSGHFSKIIKALTGCTCSLKWREAAERCIVWNVAPYHPITKGIGEYFEIPHEEMYGERFDIPDDAKLIFISWFEGGNVFRGGFTLQRGNGKIFYFHGGHETFPVYYQKEVLQVIGNAVRWAKPDLIQEFSAPCTPAIHEIRTKNEFGSAAVHQNVDGSNK